jgi:dihydroneopterin aldolase
MSEVVKLDGLVPRELEVKSSRILLDALEVQADIGFHEFEVGKPQRLLVTVEIWLDDLAAPAGDDPAEAWD